MDRSIRLEIGPYWLLIPETAGVSAEVKKPSPGAYQGASTHWTVSLGRFRLFVHLDPLHDLEDLKRFIDQATRGNVTTPSMTVNGVPGVTHGDYGPPRTRIDWWFKKGDTMICLSLQSVSFPITTPTEAEMTEHQGIITSLKYCRDFRSELPPLPN